MRNFKKIIILGVLTEIIYLTLFILDPLRRYWGDNSLVTTLNSFYLFVTFLLLLLFCLYVAISKLTRDQIDFKVIFIFFILFSLTVFFTWPLTSIDVFTYIHTSRVLSVHHANPYLFAFDNFPDDAFTSVLKNSWSSLPTPYAPLFTIISSALTFLGKNSFILSLYVFKFFFFGINILNCWLIHKIFNNPKATLLYAWNPLILFEFGVNAHNDVLTIFFLLLCLFFTFKKVKSYKNFILALFFLWCSVLIKFITAFLLPIFILLILKQTKLVKEKLIYLSLASITSIASLFVFYFPFWHNLEIFSRIIFHTNHVYSAWFFSSFLVFVLSVFFLIFRQSNFASLAAITGKSVFFIGYAFLIIKLWRAQIVDFEKTFIFYFVTTLALFYLTFFTWFMPWYLPVLLVLLIAGFSLSKSIYYFWAVHAITLYGILYYIILR